MTQKNFSSQYFFDTLIVCSFFILITQKTNVDGIPFFNFMNVSNFGWNFCDFKIKYFSKICQLLQFLLGDNLENLSV